MQVVLIEDCCLHCRHVWLCATPWTAGSQASLSLTISQSVPKFMSIESVMLSNHLILCHPLLLPSIFPSIRVFSGESALLIRWSKYHSFNFSITPSNECSGLISFRIGWLDPCVVQGTLKHLLQHHLGKHEFFGTQPSLWSNSHIRVWPLERPWLWLLGPLLARGYPPPILSRLASGSEEGFLLVNHLNF